MQGLRWCVEVGAILTAAGAWLKVVGVSSSSYWLAMLGQTIVGSGGVFVLGMPPKLASLWFGPDQISTACSIIVLGSKLGAALGLSLPPVLVRNHLNRADIEPDLKLLQQIIAGSSTLVLVFIILCSALHRMPGLPTDSTVGQLNQLFMTHDKRRVKRGGKKTEKLMAAGYFTTVNFLSSPHCFILSSPTIRMTSNPKQRPYNTLPWFQMNWDLADILRRRAYSIQTSPHPID
ncbi:unnamed protein product [Timema podura]|uniref:Uncharacterized protein n=1 Tax=Timema podura TaxID=61482 RepID=A0ABN7NJ46_TIMPD|nr:unnamed protein product [Timema podura]